MIITTITRRTTGRGPHELTQQVRDLIPPDSQGICHLFIRHTSASLIITENADPDVHKDLERFMSDLAPDGDSRFCHVAEGADDMSAHIRSVLTQTSLAIPVAGGRLQLGVWQGIYLWEHRTSPRERKVVFGLLT